MRLKAPPLPHPLTLTPPPLLCLQSAAVQKGAKLTFTEWSLTPVSRVSFSFFHPSSTGTRGGPLRGPAGLAHGGQEPGRHGDPGRRHAGPHHPHPVQVLLQAQVPAAHPSPPLL